MKILSPLDCVEEVDMLCDAGAGEFFCGLLEEQWYERYPVISVNRRPAGKGHFRRFDQLSAAVDRSHARGVPVYFTLNEHYYVYQQYALLETYIEKALNARVDSFIISDPGLMAYLHDRAVGVPIHVSTGGTVFNWRAVKFFCDEFGVASITFPRHVTLDELSNIVGSIPRVKTSVFLLNSRCVNVDGFCTFQHGLADRTILPMYRNACMLPFRVTAHGTGPDRSSVDAMQRQHMVRRQKIWEGVHVDDHPCGACALHELYNMGISSVKIVGRGNPTERKIADIRFLKRLLDFLNEDLPARQSFRKKARQLYAKTYKRPCRSNLCYFPSVMQGR